MCSYFIQGGVSERVVPEAARTQSARTTTYTYSKPSKSSSKSTSSKHRSGEGDTIRSVTGADGHDDSESIGKEIHFQ